MSLLVHVTSIVYSHEVVVVKIDWYLLVKAKFLLFEVSSWLVQIFNGLYMLFATLLKYGVREPSKNFPLLLTRGF